MLKYPKRVSVDISSMHRIILTSLASPALPYFSTLYNKRRDLLKELLNTKCVCLFCPHLFSETFPIVRIIEPHVVIHVHRSSCNVPVILVRL